MTSARREEVSTHSGMPPKDEPKVEIAEDLLAEAASSRPASAPAAPSHASARGRSRRPATGS